MNAKRTDKRTLSLLKSGFLVSLMTMLSRIFGLVRDMVIAHFFGASAAADAFFLSFRIPNFFRRLFGEGAFSQAFIPVLSEYRVQYSKHEVCRLIASVSGILAASLLLLTFLGVALAPWLTQLFAAGYVYMGESEKLQLATDMLRLTFPYVFLICMTALAGAVLNSYDHFVIPAFTPVLLNLSLILAAIYLAPWLTTPALALAWGVLIAGVAQLTLQLPFVSRKGLLVMPTLDIKHAGVQRILKLMLPTLFGVSVGQINLLIDTILASFLETGSLSWLYYSDRLLELPLALFGITIATVILPDLSRQHTTDATQFAKTLAWAVKLVCLLGVPAAIALVILSEHLIAALFYQGEMTQRDVNMAGLSLAAYGLGLIGHMLVKVLAPGYFARQDTRSPVRYGVIALVVNMILNLLLIWQLKHVGLALATSISAFVNAGLLWFGLANLSYFKMSGNVWKTAGKILFASGLMIVFLLVLKPMTEIWLATNFWLRLGQLLGLCVGGALVYVMGLVMVGIRYKDWVQ